MTATDAEKVAGIFAMVDGQCYHCAAWLAAHAQDEFPQHDWFALVGKAGNWSAKELREVVA